MITLYFSFMKLITVSDMLRRKPTRVEVTLADAEVILKNYEKEKSKYDTEKPVSVKHEPGESMETDPKGKSKDTVKQRVGYLPFISPKERDNLR